jgi:phage tail protein X
MPVSRYSRYYDLPTISRWGKLSVGMRPAVSLDTTMGSITHTIVGGETLDQLAKHYYGREDLWWRIADANPGRFPLDWRPGETIVIPPIRVATRVARR